MKRSYPVILILLVTLSLVWIFTIRNNPVRENNEKDTPSFMKLSYSEKDSFSFNKLKYYVDSLDIRSKEIVLSQTLVETDRYKSLDFLNTQNLFNLQFKGRKINYSSWKESLRDFSNWQYKHYREDQYNSYYQFLRNAKTKMKVGAMKNPSLIDSIKRVDSIYDFY